MRQKFFLVAIWKFILSHSSDDRLVEKILSFQEI